MIYHKVIGEENGESKVYFKWNNYYSSGYDRADWGIWDIGIDEDIYLPKPIEDKIDLLGTDEIEEFYNSINLIVNEVRDLKSGELNMLNNLRSEISYIANEYLEDYIIN